MLDPARQSLVLAFAHGYPVSGLATQQGDGAAAKPSSECGGAPTAIDRLICAEPSLAVLDTTMDAGFREHRDRAVCPAERERNAAGWPRVRFRPTLLEGAGIKLCEELLGDLVGELFGHGLFAAVAQTDSTGDPL